MQSSLFVRRCEQIAIRRSICEQKLNDQNSEYIARWLSKSPTRGRRLYLWLQANRYKISYRISNVPIGALATLWLGRCGLAVAGPAGAYLYGTATFAAASALSAVIILLYAMTSFIGHYLSQSAGGDSEPISDAVTRASEILSRLDGQNVPAEGRSRSIDSCLGLIQAYVRHLIDGDKNEVSVALVKYTDAEKTQLCVTNRNPGNPRPIRDTPFDGSRVLGHHAARSGRGHRVVPDLRRFPAEFRGSPTHKSVNYRSFYIIPMMKQTESGTEVLGFLSIDSPRPYAFYGNRANLIAVECGAIVNHIRELM